MRRSKQHHHMHHHHNNNTQHSKSTSHLNKVTRGNNMSDKQNKKVVQLHFTDAKPRFCHLFVVLLLFLSAGGDNDQMSGETTCYQDTFPSLNHDARSQQHCLPCPEHAVCVRGEAQCVGVRFATFSEQEKMCVLTPEGEARCSAFRALVSHGPIGTHLMIDDQNRAKESVSDIIRRCSNYDNRPAGKV